VTALVAVQLAHLNLEGLATLTVTLDSRSLLLMNRRRRCACLKLDVITT
jgi:hypothetical protein